MVLLLFLALASGNGRCDTYAAGYTPWSGWWWPSGSGGLVTGEDYNGHPAPLEKYDYVMNGRYDGPATAFGNRRYYSPGAQSWYGMCFYWAAAAILEPEPVRAGILDDTLFRVGDKKGLITVAYDGALYVTATVNGNGVDMPEGFHQVLDQYIRQQKTPVIFDLGTGEEHWNYPVYKYDIDYTSDGNTRHYTVRIYYATDGVDPDFVGTRTLSRVFHYYLELEGETITGSGWENGTIPPKKAFEPFGTEPNINAIYAEMPDRDFYAEVRQIIDAVGDPYEGNDAFEKAVALFGGHYQLVALDNDYFKMALDQGDVLYIGIDSEYGESVFLNIYYGDSGEPLAQIEQSGQVRIEADQAGDYYLEIGPRASGNVGCYQLDIRQGLAYEGILPVDPKFAWVAGVGVLSSTDAQKVIVSQMDAEGRLKDAFHLPVNGHFSGLLQRDLGFETPYQGYLRLNSDAPIDGLQVVTDGGDLMFGSDLISTDRAAAQVVYPYFNVGSLFGSERTRLGLINIGDDTEEVERQAFDEDGNLVGMDTLLLGPGRKIEVDAFDTGILAFAQSLVVTVKSGRNCLVGYLRFSRPSSSGNPYITRGTAFVPLPIAASSDLVLPHCASTAYWRTLIAVINTGTEGTRATLTAYDATGYPVDTIQRTMAPNQNLVGEVADLFQSSDVAAVRVTSDNGSICGFGLFGSADGIQYAGVPMADAKVTSTELVLPHIACLGAWGTGIGVMNIGGSASEIIFSLSDENGTFIGETTCILEQNQRISTLIKGLFDMDLLETARYLTVRSPGTIKGVYFMATSDRMRFMGGMIGF